MENGNLANVLPALFAMHTITLVGDHSIMVSTDTTERDRLDDERQVQHDRLNYADFETRQASLTKHSMMRVNLQAWDYQLGNNINGWCIGCTLKSNVYGGRWSQCSHLTLERAIIMGCEWAKRKNVTFSFSLNDLPTDIRNELVQHLETREWAGQDLGFPENDPWSVYADGTGT